MNNEDSTRIPESISNTSEVLLPQHQELIDGSVISSEIARQRGYRSMQTKADLKRLGFGGSQQLVPSLLMPIWNVNGEIGTYIIRPDSPRIMKNRTNKYEICVGSRMILDVPPAAREHLANPEVPLYITEGVRKADAAVSKGLCCIDVIGVWNWRGTNDSGGKTALPDWESIALNGRRVYIVYDSDVMTKKSVYTALCRLKGFLESRKAHVYLIYLPPGEDGVKVGLDDYFAAGHSADELISLATRELKRMKASGLPYEYLVENGGFVLLKRSGDNEQRINLTNFTARIIREVIIDNGQETSRMLTIESELGGHRNEFELPSTQFTNMNWVMDRISASAIIYPGNTNRDHARTAIQQTSTDIEEITIYTHTGWRRIDESWVYLHSNGAIGRDGEVSDVMVELHGSLSNYCLPAPPEGAELMTAVRASLGLLDLAPDEIMIPLYASIWRACITGSDFSIFICGPTGQGKSELAARIQQHYGMNMDARNLPASWSSTGHALEGMAWLIKDAIIVVDDFALVGSQYDIGKSNKDADRLIRAQGNNAGRSRMGSDGTLKIAKFPRGLTICTGEDLPTGESLRARMVVLELSPDMVDFDKMTQCQSDGINGIYSSALSGFIRWIASQYEFIISSLKTRDTSMRETFLSQGTHRRSPDNIAKLAVGYSIFLEYAMSIGAITEEECTDLDRRARNAFSAIISNQRSIVSSAEPADRFIEMIKSVIASGRCHLANPAGNVPPDPGAWGWRIGYNDEYAPRGECIGWVDEDNVYLEPNASLKSVKEMASQSGEPLNITARTLHKRLSEKGLLVSMESGRGFTTRRVLSGQRRAVLHISTSVFDVERTVDPFFHGPSFPIIPVDTGSINNLLGQQN